MSATLETREMSIARTPKVAAMSMMMRTPMVRTIPVMITMAMVLSAVIILHVLTTIIGNTSIRAASVI